MTSCSSVLLFCTVKQHVGVLLSTISFWGRGSTCILPASHLNSGRILRNWLRHCGRGPDSLCQRDWPEFNTANYGGNLGKPGAHSQRAYRTVHTRPNHVSRQSTRRSWLCMLSSWHSAWMTYFHGRSCNIDRDTTRSRVRRHSSQPQSIVSSTVASDRHWTGLWLRPGKNCSVQWEWRFRSVFSTPPPARRVPLSWTARTVEMCGPFGKRRGFMLSRFGGYRVSNYTSPVGSATQHTGKNPPRRLPT